MIIDCDNSDEEVSQLKPKPEYMDADLYKESLTSVHGFTRGPSGKIKFHKDTKKRRREEMEEGDVEMVDEGEVSKSSKKRNKVKVGHEFKAKVCSHPQPLLIGLTLITLYKARRWRCQEERHGTICIRFPWTGDWW
jgi:hypothetical protein